MNTKASLFLGLFVLLEVSLFGTSLPVKTPVEPTEITKTNQTGIRLTMKSFNLPNATNECFNILYLLELPSDMIEMLNSNQTFSIDYSNLPISKLPGGANMPNLKFFDGFDMAFIRSCLDSLGHHLGESLPEFELVGGPMAQLLGVKPVIVRVKEIEPTDGGFLITANLCFQRLDDKAPMKRVDPVFAEEKGIVSGSLLEYASNLPTAFEQETSAHNALPLISGRKDEDNNIGWPEVVASLIIFTLIASLCGCFCYC